MKLIDLFRCYESSYEKIRIGTKNGDGGYVVINTKDLIYDAFISAGISNNSDFEEEFLLKFPELEKSCYLFDAQIDNTPNKLKDISNFWIKKNISIVNNDNNVDIRNYTLLYNNIFLKMDIESAEWNIFEALTQSDLNKFSQIVIEFHHLDQIILQTPRHNIYEGLSKINQTHYMLHVHANNAKHSNGEDPNNTFDIDGVRIPKILEATFLRKNLVKDIKLNTQNLPSELDRPCREPIDIDLNFYPFVTKCQGNSIK
jgi:hypothetical protein